MKKHLVLFLATHNAHSKDSDQTGRMPRLSWVFTEHTGHFIAFVMQRLRYVTLLAAQKHRRFAHQYGVYRKKAKNSDTRKIDVIILKFEQCNMALP